MLLKGLSSEAQRARMRVAKQWRNSPVLGAARSTPSPFCASSSHDRYAVVSRRATWLLTFLGFTALGFLNFEYRYLDDLARLRQNTFTIRLFEEMTGAYSGMLLFPFVVWLVRRARIRVNNWWRTVPLTVLVMAAFSVSDTTLMAISRGLLWPLFGLGKYDYGIMLYRYPMEFANHVLPFWATVATIYVFDSYREARNRQLATAELEARLAEAQLQNLRLQLQPHFLFNALNTISSVMREDVDRADSMLAQLGALLRRTLRTASAQEIPLDDELELLKSYVAIMEERFGDGLHVDVVFDPALSNALVPQLILQPMVENSIRHARTPQNANLDVSVRASQDRGELVLQVQDNGPGILDLQMGGWKKGIGLSNTQERLEGLYGPNHELTLENSNGLLVTIRFPLRMAVVV
jgi:two-component system, LytTR family, sensor kinase